MDTGFLGFFFGFFFIVLALSIAHLVGQIWALVDLLGRQDAQVVGDSRVLWALIVIFIPFAWLAYLIAGRR